MGLLGTMSEPEVRRTAQCPARRPGMVPTCGDVDVKLGWRHGLPIDLCDQCWNAGVSSPEARAMRGRWVERARDAAMSHPSPPKHVLLTIAGHLPPEQAAVLLVHRALYLGESAVEAARLLGIPTDDILRTLEGASPRERLEGMSPRDRWARVRRTWVPRGWSLLRAVCSGVVGVGVYRERWRSCMSCPSRKQSRRRGKWVCGECGCGDHPLARLDWKLWLRRLECPRGRRGFANEVESDRARESV